MTTQPAPAAPASAATPNTAPNVAVLAPRLAWLAARAALDRDARMAAAAAHPAALAPGAADPGALVQALLDAGRPAEALRVVACALPPREGAWWAWVAARHAAQAGDARGEPASDAEGAALAAAERWIWHLTDESRRATWDAAQAAGLDTPAGAAAGAVYFTGGSVMPPNGPLVPPPPGMHATVAATAVLLAAMATDAARLREVAAAFAEQGVEIVRRSGGWDAAIDAAWRLFDAQTRHCAEVQGRAA